jgi:macrolide-specific efflux system membrane fusion protein
VLQASALVSVGAQVSGIVKSVHVTLGQEVKAGDLVAEIDSLAQENALKSAEASLANIVAQKAAQQAGLAQTERTLARAREMSAQRLVTQADLESAEAALASANAQLAALDAQIEQATLNVESAHLNLSRTRISAPMAGTVVAVLVEAGQTLSASQSAPTVVKIANLDSMLIRAEISEADVTRVEPGQKVYFTILGEPGRRIEARLRSVDPAPPSIASEGNADTSSSAVYYNGIFEVPNPDRRLRIAMTAQVSIVLAAAENALLVPSASVQRAGRGAVLRVYDPRTGTVTPRPVRVGLDNKVMAQIVDGLSEGELVVTGARGAAQPRGTGGAGARPGGGLLGGGGPPIRF